VKVKSHERSQSADCARINIHISAIWRIFINYPMSKARAARRLADGKYSIFKELAWKRDIQLKRA
jgi:hypothetical protein